MRLNYKSLHRPHHPDHFAMYHHPVISFWLQRINWSSGGRWHGGVSTPPWANWSSPTLRVSRRTVVRRTPEAFHCHVFTALVMCLSLETAVELSGEGVQSGAAISHFKHILLTGKCCDTIMTSPGVHYCFGMAPMQTAPNAWTFFYIRGLIASWKHTQAIHLWERCILNPASHLFDRN